MRQGFNASPDQRYLQLQVLAAGNRGSHIERGNHDERVGRMRILSQHRGLAGQDRRFEHTGVRASVQMRTSLACGRPGDANQIAKELAETSAKQGSFIFWQSQSLLRL